MKYTVKIRAQFTVDVEAKSAEEAETVAVLKHCANETEEREFEIEEIEEFADVLPQEMN